MRTNSSVLAFAVLSPRQEITPAPMAIYATSAGSATTASSVSANAVTGSGIQDATLTAPKIAGGQVVKSLNGLMDTVLLSAGTNITLSPTGNTIQISSSGGGNFSGWALGGNSSTVATNFLGTLDNHVLELRVNNTRGLRLELNGSGQPNVIGGHSSNIVAASLVGVVIGGCYALSPTDRALPVPTSSAAFPAIWPPAANRATPSAVAARRATRTSVWGPSARLAAAWATSSRPIFTKPPSRAEIKT